MSDFGLFGAAWGVPAVFWAVGGVDPDTYAKAEKAGKLDELPVNHSPGFAPVIEPTLRVGIEAAVPFGWSEWLGERGLFVGMKGFGASAPAEALFRHFGITPEAVAEAVRKRLAH